MLARRQFLIGSMVSVLPAFAGCSRPSPWERAAYRKRDTSQVAIVEAQSYDTSLQEIVRRGIQLFRIPVHGKIVVLKPNLVEFDPAGVINTHPALIAATIAAFKSLGAREVCVAEGPGHRRDNEYLLAASGLYTVLKDAKARYVDLNYDDVRALPLRSHFTSLQQLYFPETILQADLLVSMPKLKTHHWVGATLALKNMFGVIPSAVYGWLMKLEPQEIKYLAKAGQFLGNIATEKIHQIGEKLEPFQQDFHVIDAFRYLKTLRA